MHPNDADEVFKVFQGVRGYVCLSRWLVQVLWARKTKGQINM